MQDKTFTLKVVMSGEDVSDLFAMLARVVDPPASKDCPVTQWACYWKGVFEQALEQSTSQVIREQHKLYRFPGR